MMVDPTPREQWEETPGATPSRCPRAAADQRQVCRGPQARGHVCEHVCAARLGCALCRSPRDSFSGGGKFEAFLLQPEPSSTRTRSSWCAVLRGKEWSECMHNSDVTYPEQDRLEIVTERARRRLIVDGGVAEGCVVVNCLRGWDGAR